MIYPKRISVCHGSPQAFVNDDRGLSTVEYVVILVLIAVAAIGTWKQFGGTILAKVDTAGNCIRDMEGNCSTSGQGPSTPHSNNDSPGPANVVTPVTPAKPATNVNTPAPQPVAKQAKGKVLD